MKIIISFLFCFLALVSNSFAYVIVYDKVEKTIFWGELGKPFIDDKDRYIVKSINEFDPLLKNQNDYIKYDETNGFIKKSDEEIIILNDSKRQAEIKEDIESLLSQNEIKLKLAKEGYDVSSDTQTIRAEIDALKAEKVSLEAKE